MERIFENKSACWGAAILVPLNCAGLGVQGWLYTTETPIYAFYVSLICTLAMAIGFYFVIFKPWVITAKFSKKDDSMTVEYS